MIIADTGFWLALANAKDLYHERARAFLAENTLPYITTWPVMTETSHLLCQRLGVQALLRFMESYRDGAFVVFDLLEIHRPRLIKLMEKYQDLPMDLADASLVILAESLDKGLIVSTDQRDFQTYKWKNRKPFKNLLLPG